jgi:sec-independent protein translocase protein TatC
MSATKSPGKVMPLLGHIRELRNRALGSLLCYLACFIVALVFSNRIIGLFTSQFANVSSEVESSMVVTTIVEGFVSRIKLSAIAGLVLSTPAHIFNLLRFVFPGLERRHRIIILAFITASSVLILAGSYLAYFRVIPLAIRFLTNPFFVPPGVGFLLNYQSNIFYVLSFILWSLLTLQLPLVLEVLLMLNVLKRRAVFKASRYVIVAIFVLAAIVTPPDFISQLGVALPLLVLYFLVILVAKIFRFGEA